MPNQIAETATIPTIAKLRESVRRNLGLLSSDLIDIVQVSEFSNINYVYRCSFGDKNIYLKVAPRQLRNFPVEAPQERVLSEAAALKLFRELAGEIVFIPEVLFVDEEYMLLAMSDVGEGRDILFTVLAAQFDLLLEQANRLGEALGKIHRHTQGKNSLRPADEEALVRNIIFRGLLGPGAQAVFPELWPDLSAAMQTHRECLVHGDLWSKNLLVRAASPAAIVDFEGVTYGDPAFDLATLSCVALLPAFENPQLLSSALEFVRNFLETWRSACGSQEWAHEVFPRVFQSSAVFLAARGFGPFAYAMSAAARDSLRELAQSLAERPPASLDAFTLRISSVFEK